MDSDCSSPSSSKRSHDSSMSHDIEDIGQRKKSTSQGQATPTFTKHKATPPQDPLSQKGWRDILGPPPDMGSTRVGVANMVWSHGCHVTFVACRRSF